MGQDAARQEGVELVTDELRQPGTGGLFGLGKETLGMLLHHAVQRGLLGDRWCALWTGAPSQCARPQVAPCRLPATGAAPPPRRTALALGLAQLLGPSLLHARPFADPDGPRWYAAAAAMRTLAESWGDQPYGAVLVKGDRIIGHGPSRVIRNRNPDAHAEREALRDAIARWGPDAVHDAVLYSTSRPCAACEQALARARIARIVYGEALLDGGVPARR